MSWHRLTIVRDRSHDEKLHELDAKQWMVQGYEHTGLKPTVESSCQTGQSTRLGAGDWFILRWKFLLGTVWFRKVGGVCSLLKRKVIGVRHSTGKCSHFPSSLRSRDRRNTTLL
jgi:hypothetical protein